MDKFFNIIGKISSVLFFIVLLGIVGVISWSFFAAKQSLVRGQVGVVRMEEGKEKKILLELKQMENIKGADTQMMRLTSKGDSLKSYSGYGSEALNVLFLKGAEKQAYWLFKDHKNHILAISQLRPGSDESKDASTSALYFEYIAKDSNADGKLTNQDYSIVGIAKPDGTEFVDILHDISQVYSYQMRDQDNLSIVYQKEASIRHAKFKISTMKLESDQEVMKMPSDI
jgi:hypothetical protein